MELLDPFNEVLLMPRDYKNEYAKYQGKPEQIKKRAMRNQARREMIKKGKVSKGDGKDVDHTKPLAKGGTNSLMNLGIKTASNNRSFKRTKKAKMA